MLKEWTAVDISHATVGTILKRVGEAQIAADEEMVQELEKSDVLPDAKEVDYLYAEADGVYVPSTKKRKHMEVAHSIMYEGWQKNGERVSLKNRRVFIMTTQPTDDFWTGV